MIGIVSVTSYHLKLKAVHISHGVLFLGVASSYQSEPKHSRITLKTPHLLFGVPWGNTRERAGWQDGCREGEPQLICLFSWKPGTGGGHFPERNVI